MMNVGLETSPASSPSPAATPFVSTVFPAPSSPQSASTSPGRARRARRSPMRSVCRDDWLTRSTLSVLPGASVRRSALESAALNDEPNGKAEERAEERGPDEEPVLARDAADQIERRPRTASERRGERNEAQPPHHGAPAPQPLLAREESRATASRLFLGPVLLRHSPSLERRDAAPIGSEAERRLRPVDTDRVGWSEDEEPRRADVDRGARAAQRDEGVPDLPRQARGTEPEEAQDGRCVLTRRRAVRADTIAVDRAEPARGHRTAHDGADTACMCARDRLGTAPAPADDDPAALSDVDTDGGKVVGGRVDAERQLSERIGPVRRDARERPRVALDRHLARIRARHRAIERRADGPRADDGRELEVAISADVDDAAIDRRGHRAREATPRPRDDRAALDMRVGRHAHHSLEIGRCDAQRTRAADTHRRSVRRARGDDVAGTDGLADRRLLDDPDRERVSGDMARVTPAHASSLEGSASS